MNAERTLEGPGACPTDARPLRILRLIPSLDPRSGGPAEGLIRSTVAIAKLGHHTETVCVDAPDAPWLKDLPFRAHALGPATRRYGYSSKVAPFIRSHRHRFDVAVVHSLWNYSSVAAWRALAGSSTPYVLFAHGMLDPWFRSEYPLKHLVKQAYWFLLQGRVLTDAYAVLFTTEEERRLARMSFRGHRDFRTEVVAYGAAGPDGAVEAGRSALRAAVPGLNGRPFLLHLGRIHPKKGCDLLVTAFAELAGTAPDLDLVMAGPDETGWQDTLRRMATSAGVASRIHWPGMLRGDAKWGALRGAEAFVLPSHGENFGIAVAEALACGTPVLISDKVNIWREVAGAQAGLVAADDAGEIAALLRRFLALSPEEKASMGRAALGCHRRHFEIGAAGRSLLAVLQHAAASAAPDFSPATTPAVCTS